LIKIKINLPQANVALADSDSPVPFGLLALKDF